ncbi:MAG TPA: 4-(cytidine 5'-diphospho)-2-C-methyl-D-erythritol kinase [Candidatus Hydrothermia bacterium]|nr:4-(cytidine 5'-diphospho)-2-C-methyl-D-erythritol kinase [Candidatus Hydrothermia bacterium]
MTHVDTIKSYAKINLGLWVTEKREDNYHNIVTVLHKIGIHDIISVTPHTEFEIVAWGMPFTKDNIILKVKELVEKRFGINVNYRVEIRKNIPVGSGLGGASSNAAYFLKYLNDKRNLGLSVAELVKLGSQIGADVPFFLLNENAAIATGKGDILEPIKSNFNYPLIVSFSSCQVLTSWAYKAFDELGSFSVLSKAYKKVLTIAEALENNDLNGLSIIENDFEKVILKYYPEVLQKKDLLYSMGANIVSMSGSGNAVFGIFERMILIENYGQELVPSTFLEIE